MIKYGRKEKVDVEIEKTGRFVTIRFDDGDVIDSLAIEIGDGEASIDRLLDNDDW